MAKDKPQKKVGIVYRVFSIVFSLVLVGLVGLFIYNFYNLNLLPTNLMIPACLVIGLFTVLILILFNFFAKNIFTKILMAIIVIALCVTSAYGSYYLYKTAATMVKITSNEGKVKNTISIISLNSSGLKELKDLDGKTVAELKTLDSYGTKQIRKAVRKELELNSEDKLPFNQTTANSVQEMVNMLYTGEVDAIVLNESYRNNVSEIEQFMDFNDATNVVYQAVYYTEDPNEALAVSNITTTPFNILVSGKDTDDDQAVYEAARSDVNMLITVNPLTSTVLMTSIPRDMYVETVCSGEDSCMYGGMDKITHTGIYGIGTTKATVENYLGVQVNYTFEVNYSSVISIVDAIGGIDVYIEEGMAVPQFFADNSLEGVQEGWNHLDGQRALAFARERHAYLDGDNQRVRNQQQVLEACFAKATSPEIIKNYASLMDAVSNAFVTNMSTDEITDLIKYQVQTMTEWTFESYQICGYGDMLMCAALGSEASVTVPYPEAAYIANQKIQAVMNGQSSYTVEDTLGAGDKQGALSEEDIRAQIAAEVGYGDYYYYDPNAYYEETEYYEESYYEEPSEEYYVEEVYEEF